MKKAFYVLGFVAIAAIMLSSCKKDYTCDCTYSDNINGQILTGSASYPITARAKSTAEAACSSYEVGDAHNWTCVLK